MSSMCLASTTLSTFDFINDDIGGDRKISNQTNQISWELSSMKQNFGFFEKNRKLLITKF